MIAVLSATEHDFYAMPLPFAVYSWAKIGVRCVVFVPNAETPKLDLAYQYCRDAIFHGFDAEEKRIPTFSQVSRLFGGAINGIENGETLVTADSDICVFTDYFKQLDDGRIHVVGADLTPNEQYPMCFIAMPKHEWMNVMEINKTYQEHIAELINPIEGLNIRGEQWSYDQWYVKRKLDLSNKKVILHNRSNGQNQFATRRADRDGWYFDPFDIIDAHLPRPLTDEHNFNKVYELFKTKYPFDDLNWMIEYRNKYIEII